MQRRTSMQATQQPYGPAHPSPGTHRRSNFPTVASHRQLVPDRTERATDSEAFGCRLWGYCVTELYHRERTHQGLGNEILD